MPCQTRLYSGKGSWMKHITSTCSSHVRFPCQYLIPLELIIHYVCYTNDTCYTNSLDILAPPPTLDLLVPPPALDLLVPPPALDLLVLYM